MSTVTDVSEYLSTLNTGTTELSSDSSALASMDAFYDLLVAEITNQDPTEPMDNSDLVLQLAQMSSLEATNALSENMETFIEQSSLTSATELIGKEVTYLDADDTGEEISGTVTAVTRTSDDTFEVTVNGVSVPMDYITDVTAAESDTTTTTDTTTDTTTEA